MALWRPGAYAKEREQAYFDVRFARERPAYPHTPRSGVFWAVRPANSCTPSRSSSCSTLLGFDWPRADAFRGALLRGRIGERIDHERYLRQEAKKQGWTAERADGLVALLLEHAGYLHSHGHSLAMAQHAFRQACLKVSPGTTPEFFAEVLNHGGSPTYGQH